MFRPPRLSFKQDCDATSGGDPVAALGHHRCPFGNPVGTVGPDYSVHLNSVNSNSGRASFLGNSQLFNSVNLTLMPANASFWRSSQLFDSIKLTLIPARASFRSLVAILASAVWGSCACKDFACVAGFQHHGGFAGGPGSQAREEGKQHH